MVFFSAGLFAAPKQPGTIREKISVSNTGIIEDAVNKASLEDNWKIVKLKGHNVIFATVDAGECILSIKITYTEKDYVIEYKGSNLSLLDDCAENALVNLTYNNKVTALNNNVLKAISVR